MPDVDVLKAAQIYFTGMPLAFAAAIFFAPKEFMAAYRATAVDPVPDEGTPAYDMLVLVMKWWAFALASTGVATGIVAQNCDAKINKLFLKTMSVFSGVGGLALTYANLEFAKKMNGDNPTDMGPIYFNVGLQIFGLALGQQAAAAAAHGHGHSHGHAHDGKKDDHHGHGHDEDGNCLHGHGHDKDESPSRSRSRSPSRSPSRKRHSHGHGGKKGK